MRPPEEFVRVKLPLSSRVTLKGRRLETTMIGLLSMVDFECFQFGWDDGIFFVALSILLLFNELVKVMGRLMLF